MFVLFGGFLIALSMADRSLKAARWGAAAFLVGAGGILLDALRPIGEEWWRHLALTLHFITVALFIQAFARRHGEDLPTAALGIAAIASLLFLPYQPLAPSPEARLVIVQLVAFSMLATVLPRAVRWRDGRAIGRLVVGALGLAALSYLVRAGLFVIRPDTAPVTDFFASFYNVAFHLTTAVVGLALGLVLLVALGSDAVRRENRESAMDPLTGLGNRRRLHWAINSDEEGKWTCGSVIAIDLDHFKAVNDRYGHDGGDRVLIAVADALKFVFRGQRICRLGGEEFVILLPRDMTGQLSALAARALAAIEALRFEAPLDNCRVSACVGTAIRQQGMGIDEMLRRADKAVYRGKAQGRGQVNSADAANDGTRPADRRA
ncbi:GGDEF domain-containing protein [Sphingomicrobium astaxanthinifaciens]|uniref:GGDEF domain-containing protein n=1 Tax=Sphingomicrobium astaxanthinifaciens TaxID=1227949 RepID=UPI001FCC83FD|nr:GGDEF domain-containing protein [Sphingomicrobium astaxanthinifaciens]MCJ7420698.1 GGDEF domain-containing protein [Sphingomicrobium astaxanthinifaciens]